MVHRLPGGRPQSLRLLPPALRQAVWQKSSRGGGPSHRGRGQEREEEGKGLEREEEGQEGEARKGKK